jgi:hypothetical protein
MDEDQLFLRPAAAPPHINRRPTEGSLEFLMEQLAPLATRWDLAKYAFLALSVGAVIGIVGIEAFWRYIPACGST